MRKADEEGYKIICIYQEDVYNHDEAWLEKELLPEILNSDRNPTFISSLEELYEAHIETWNNDDPNTIK